MSTETREMDDLVAEREALTDALSECERGCYPGSSEYQRESAALRALGAFDAAHPDVLPEIRRRDRLERGLPADPLADAIARGI